MEDALLEKQIKNLIQFWVTLNQNKPGWPSRENVDALTSAIMRTIKLAQ